MKTALLSLRWLTLLLVPLGLLLAALVLALRTGQAASSPSAPRTWRATVGVQSADYAIQGMVFLPGDLWINVGDTVVWTTQSSDTHTVSFLPQGKQPAPLAPLATELLSSHGGTHYDGRSTYSSDRLATFPSPASGITTYQLTFEKIGDFTYFCLVHTMMKAHIHVRAAGTPYPYTQAQYDGQVRQQTAALLRQGHVLAQQAAARSSAHQVILGIGSHPVSVMRFFPQTIVIHVGDTVTFTDRDRMDEDPHTVNFMADGSDVYSGDPKHFDGTSSLSSGFLGYTRFARGSTFKITFTKAGTYHFTCDWHDFMEMKAVVIVRA